LPDYGLLPEGFRRRRYADIMTAMEARARNLFGENINLTERSPLGLFLRIVAWSIGILWQVAESVYNAAFVDTATGHSLDKVGLYVGIVRRPAERATGEITITGDEDTVIPAGFVVGTADGLLFETTEGVTIDTDGSITAPIVAQEPGTAGNVPMNTITEIINPAVGVDEATNAEQLTGGRNRETDAEFRERYLQSVAIGGASTVDSIRAALLQTAGVRAALVVENNTMEEDAAGRPAKSIECYTLGGEAADIAATILATKAAGIQAHGSETETVQDDAGQEHNISYTPAEVVNIEVDVAVDYTAEYPADGHERIRTEIIRYIGGYDADGALYAGLSMGQDVIYSKIIERCYQIPGVRDVAVTVNEAGQSAGTSNITIDFNEVAETDSTKVVVDDASG